VFFLVLALSLVNHRFCLCVLSSLLGTIVFINTTFFHLNLKYWPSIVKNLNFIEKYQKITKFSKKTRNFNKKSINVYRSRFRQKHRRSRRVFFSINQENLKNFVKIQFFSINLRKYRFFIIFSSLFPIF
jgi:hypothetical protein